MEVLSSLPVPVLPIGVYRNPDPDLFRTNWNKKIRNKKKSYANSPEMAPLDQDGRASRRISDAAGMGDGPPVGVSQKYQTSNKKNSRVFRGPFSCLNPDFMTKEDDVLFVIGNKKSFVLKHAHEDIREGRPSSNESESLSLGMTISEGARLAI